MDEQLEDYLVHFNIDRYFSNPCADCLFPSFSLLYSIYPKSDGGSSHTHNPSSDILNSRINKPTINVRVGNEDYPLYLVKTRNYNRIDINFEFYIFLCYGIHSKILKNKTNNYKGGKANK